MSVILSEVEGRATSCSEGGPEGQEEGGDDDIRSEGREESRGIGTGSIGECLLRKTGGLEALLGGAMSETEKQRAEEVEG